MQPSDTETCARVTLNGDYDVANATSLIDQLMVPSQAVVIGDMAGITFMDSTSIRALLEVHQRLGSEGRTIRLVNPSPLVRRVFEVMQLCDVFGLPPT